jgi:adenylylsulfate kinase
VHALCAGQCPTTSTYTIEKATNIKWFEGAVERGSKERLLDQRGCVLWFTGLSGSGKSTVACTLEHALAQRGKLTMLLDGDNIRWAPGFAMGF